MPDAQVSTVIKKGCFLAGVPLIFLSCVSLSLLSALLIILIPVITINYTINYTDRCTKGYNVKQAGTSWNKENHKSVYNQKHNEQSETL